MPVFDENRRNRRPLAFFDHLYPLLSPICQLSSPICLPRGRRFGEKRRRAPVRWRFWGRDPAGVSACHAGGAEIGFGDVKQFLTIIFLSGFFLIGTGCHTPYTKEVVWHQPGKTQREIQMDFGDCKMRAHSVENPLAPFSAGAAISSASSYWDYVRDCMESKGYTRCPRDEVPAGEATIR